MKTAQLLSKWDTLTSQVQALSLVKKRVAEGISISGLLEELTHQIKVLSDQKDRVEGDLEHIQHQLFVETGLVNVPPEMKIQWQHFAVDRELPDIVRALIELKESGQPLHHFLNSAMPLDDE